MIPALFAGAIRRHMTNMEDLAADIPKILSVFGLAFFYFWPAVLAGLALGVHPAIVVAVTTLSYLSGVAVVLVPGGRVRAWVMKRWGHKFSGDSNSLPRRIWNRFGAAGLGLLAPMTVGAQTGALVGVALNAPPRRLFLWMALGALGWSLLITGAALIGIVGVQQAAQ